LGCVFNVAPNFHNADLHAGTKFSSVTKFPECFRDTFSDGASEKYRTLRLKMNAMHATSEELGFFVLEMKSRARDIREEPMVRRAAYLLYEALAMYGQSVFRPFLVLVATTAIFWLLYGWLAMSGAADPRAFTLALNGSIPFAGALRWS